MSKRPAIDLNSLTSDEAAPMHGAVQRTAPPPTQVAKNGATAFAALAFKVRPEFREEFIAAAFHAKLKLNQLLVEALAAWKREKAKSK